MRGEQISMTHNNTNADMPQEFPVLDAQLSATAMTMMGACIEPAFDDAPQKVEDNRNLKMDASDVKSNIAVHR